MKNLKTYCLLMGATTLIGACTKEKQVKPNVIIMYIDDLDFSELGYYNRDVLTPCVDSLAANGLILNNFYASAPLSSPSRYSALTGKYASFSSSFSSLPANEPVYIRWNADIVEGKEKTMAHFLKPLGYQTGFVGKWHNGQPIPEDDLLDTDPNRPDLNEYLANVYELQRSHIQKSTGFDFVESIYGNNLHVTGLPKSMQYHNMEWITQGALNFIDQNKKNPFFLWFSTTVPHLPDPNESIEADPRITPSGILKVPIDVQPSRQSLLKRISDTGKNPKYAAMLWLDDAVQAIINKLEKENLLENTMIIFASDNGDERGKMTCYEAAAHIPAFVYWKGKIKAGSTNELMSNIDFLPTLLDLSGATYEPENLNGLSWKNTLLYRDSMPRQSLYLEVVYQRAVVTKDWKLITTRFPAHIQQEVTPQNRKSYSIEGEKSPDRYGNEFSYPGYYDNDQLYRLSDDPNEQVNLFGLPEYKKVQENMQDLIQYYCAQTPFAFGEYGKK